MSQSPFQKISLDSDDAEFSAPPVRRLRTPAERFQAGEIARVTENLDVEMDSQNDVETESQRAAPDPFQQLPRAEQTSVRNRQGAQKRRARRRIKPHSPHYHEKKPHIVEHKPIKPASETPPQNDWDKAAQNSMARAMLARKRNRTRRIVTRIVLAAGVLLLAWGGTTALTAPQFEINRIDISGTDRTPLAQVKKLVGQLVGKNIFRAPRGAVAAQVAAIPTVKSARLERVWSWPPHMALQIVERQPILQVGAGENWWVADAQGVAFRRADGKDGALYQLTSPQFKPTLGKPLPAAPWKRASELRADLVADNALVAKENGGENQGKFWDLRRVYLDANGAAALRISGAGAQQAHAEMLIRLGDDDWPAKLKQARVALAYFDRTGRKASELDLVSGEHPRWSPKMEAANPQNPSENLDVTPAQ